MRRLRWSAALLALACATAREPATAREALSAYALALEEGRVRDAWALLSDEAKNSMPFEAFERMVRENPEEMRELAQALRGPQGPAEVTAVATGPDGRSLRLVLEHGRWRLDAGSIDPYGQDSPEAALRTFARAWRSRRWDVMLRLVPDAEREGLDAKRVETAFTTEMKPEVEAAVHAIEALLPTAVVEQIGDHATMTWGSSGALELVREHGVWKILDLR